MNFTENEKVAIAKAIGEVVIADGKVNYLEGVYATHLDNLFGISSIHVGEAINMRTGEAIDILKRMTNHKKDLLQVMLNEMAYADGTVTPEEAKTVINILSNVGITIP